MIIVQSDNLIEAAKRTFLKLYDGEPNRSDPSIFREDVAVIQVSEPDKQEPAFELRENKLYYIGDYLKYYPDMDKDLPRIEQEHFTEILLEPGHIDAITDHLKQHPDSRRGLVSTWAPKYLLHPKQSGVCITQLYFRMKDGRLEVHSHSRANDAYRLLLLDMQLSTWAQQEIAGRLGVDIGEYIHFVDSLQLYSKNSDAIKRQRTYVLSAPAWQ